MLTELTCEEVEVIAEGASHDGDSHGEHESGTISPAVTSVAATGAAETPKVTALSACHMHETQQFCMGPSATDDSFCMSPAGGEVLAQVQTADGEEPAGEVSADGGTCEAVERDYNIPLRIGLVFAILATASIGVFGPIFLSLGRFKRGSIVMSIIKQFGTGVIISTALVHATTAAIVMAGIVISFVPEYVGARVFLWRVSKHTAPSSPSPEQSHEPKGADTTETSVGHHLVHSGDAHTQSPALQKLKVNIMEAGIIFHSLREFHHGQCR
ncbi:unnamed protein product [Aureobasidium uvarum]|uniref:Uncharacterized protein n=1 Tax=Aureobasidium uvarum TaxID=2773716 RepID=A0A9N8KMB3_9PEZI|nr:unnamed protein product [Aureobasidium uvarum]